MTDPLPPRRPHGRRATAGALAATCVALVAACAGGGHDDGLGSLSAARFEPAPASTTSAAPTTAAPTTAAPPTTSAPAPATTPTLAAAPAELARAPRAPTATPGTAPGAGDATPPATSAPAAPAPTTAPAPSGPPPAGGTPGSLGRCRLFPASSYWYANVSTMPVHASSGAYVASIGATSGLKADFGSGLWDGGPIGIPYVVVPAGQPKVPITFEYADESDPGPYPIPEGAPIEGGAASTGDRHVLVVDQTDCRLYETWATQPASGGWTAGSGAVFDLSSNALRPDGWTSADAAGLPILPGLVRYDEVAAGRIDHAIRITVPRTQKAYVWPARHVASSRTDASLPPMGLWLRLRADFDTSGFPQQARVVLEALKQHGAIVADNGSAWYLSGAPDERWDNDALATLRRVPGSAFEAIDVSSMIANPGSGQVR